MFGYAFHLLVVGSIFVAGAKALEINSPLTLPQKATALFTGANVAISAHSRAVFLFLNPDSHCSRAHEPVIQKLTVEFPSVKFYGILSASVPAAALDRWKTLGPNFVPVIDDRRQQTWLKTFKALKTPHAFVVDQGVLKYRGGISASNDPAQSKSFPLRDALLDLAVGRPVAKPQTRVIGCPIDRE